MKKRIILVVFLILAIFISITLASCNLFNRTPDSEKMITVNFETDGGSKIAPVEIIRAELTVDRITSYETFKEGFDIDYWYVLNNGVRDKNIAKYLSNAKFDTITVGVVWKVKKLKVNIVQNLEVEEATFTISIDQKNQIITDNNFSTEVLYNSKIEVESLLTYTYEGIGDFEFLGWRINSAEELETKNSLSIEKVVTDIRFEAIWKSPVEININFYNNIDSEDKEIPQELSLGVGLIHQVYPTKIKPASVFAAWTTVKDDSDSAISDENGKTSQFPKLGTLNSTKVYAKWESSISITYTVDESNNATVTGVNPLYKDTRIYIPSKIADAKVIKIGADSFKGLSNQYDVIIPYTVNNIDITSFSNYKGKIYFDIASNYDLIAATRFSTTHEIYVHATNILQVEEKNKRFNNKYRLGNEALIDGVFINYFGEIVTDKISTQKEVEIWHRYSIEFTLQNEVALDCTAHEDNKEGVSDEILLSKIVKNLSVTVIANDTDSKSSPSWYSRGKVLKMPRKILRTNYLIGQDTTVGGKRQVQAIDLLYKEENNTAEDRYLPIEFLPEIQVYNSEQAFYVVQRGFQPVFISKEQGAPREPSSSAKLAYNEVIKIVKKITRDDMSDFKKVEVIHDWIAMNNIYDTTLLELFLSYTPDQINHYRGFYLEGTVLDGKGVCDSIAKSFVMMSRAIGLEAIKVEGVSHGGGGGSGVAHAWNKVKIEDEWYVLDTTGNDPTVSDSKNINNGKSFEVLKHKYYLVPNNDAELIKKNTEKSDMGYPLATGKYDYFGYKTYDGTRAIKVNTIAEIENYLTYIKGNTIRKKGELYSLEVYSTSVDVESQARKIFTNEYIGSLEKDGGHFVLLFRGN